MLNFDLILKAYRGVSTPLVRAHVIEQYEVLFGKKLKVTMCSDCIRDAATEIMVKLLENRKYLLKANTSIKYKGEIYFQATLTDELAEQILKEFPEYSVKFKRLPEIEVVEVKSEPVEEIIPDNAEKDGE